jgi:hypothetical protein
MLANADAETLEWADSYKIDYQEAVRGAWAGDRGDLLRLMNIYSLSDGAIAEQISEVLWSMIARHGDRHVADVLAESWRDTQERVSLSLEQFGMYECGSRAAFIAKYPRVAEITRQHVE